MERFDFTKFKYLKEIALKENKHSIVNYIDELFSLKERFYALNQLLQHKKKNNFDGIEFVEKEINTLIEKMFSLETNIEIEASKLKEFESFQKKQNRKLRNELKQSKDKYIGSIANYDKALHGPVYRANYKRRKKVVR